MANDNTGGSMGRGTIYMTGAILVLAVTTYAIQFGLGHILSPESYGVFGITWALMTAITLLVTTGFPDAAAKHIAEDDTKIIGIIRSSRNVQLVISIALLAAYLGAAGALGDAFHEPRLAQYVRVTAFAIPACAMYQLYLAYLNGLRRFGMQALVIILSSIVRVGLVFALVYLGLGIEGAVLGYIGGAVVGLVIARKYVGSVQGNGGAVFPWRRFVAFGIPATLFAVIMYLMMSVDLFAVKTFFEEGDPAAGYYNAATVIARAPNFLFAALPLTLLPLISRSTAVNDRQLTRTYITESLRYLLMLLVPCTVLISATSRDLVSMIYPGEYAQAADPLEILVLGLAFLTVFQVLAQIIIASGKPTVAFGVGLFSLVLDVVLNVVLVPHHGLVGAAGATCISTFVGMVASGLYVFGHFRVILEIKSFGRILLASLVLYVVAVEVSVPHMFLLLLYVGLFVLYFGLLILTRELSKGDLQTLRRVIPFLGGDAGANVSQ